MKISSELLKKYAQNECSESEIILVEQWLNSDENSNFPNDFKGRGGHLWNKIDAQTSTKANNPKTWFIAASITLLIGFTSFQFLYKPKLYGKTYQTLAGEVKTVTLNDGTVVYLNANSILKISNKFNKNTRTVLLNGEGYFEVAKDSMHPFIINTEMSHTRVLGTKFNLSAYADENVILTLNEGKVLFENQKKSQKLILLPNDQAYIKNDSLTKTNVNPSYYNSWVNHKMYLNNEVFTEVIHKIERTYNVHIVINKPKLKDYLCKGVYDNSSLDKILQDLSFVLKFKYKINEKEISIY